MAKFRLVKFLSYLMKDAEIIAPQRMAGELVMTKVDNPKKVELTNELPLYSFKKYLVPPEEVLFVYKKNEIKQKADNQRLVIFGLTIPDLKAIVMLDQVFAHDPYYQKRMENTLIVGHSLVPDKNHQFFIEKFSEDILEHLKFDIFLGVRRFGFDVYTGSEDGQRVLEDFGYKDYEHIEYVGPVKESGPDHLMLKIKKAMEDNPSDPLWEKLGKICIECGKCTMICPTCFCFDILDQAGMTAKSGERQRYWSACFYTDFSKVASPNPAKPRFLETTRDRIKFWYEHKFVRIPHEFSIEGCVGCGRCTKVCPVGIDIKKNLQKILKSKNV